MKRVMTAVLVAVLSFSVAACQTGSGGGGTVVVDSEPRTLTEWVIWINRKLVQACGYQASFEFLLQVFGKAPFTTVISEVCNVVEAARLQSREPRSRRLGVIGGVAGVPFNPLTDGKFTR